MKFGGFPHQRSKPRQQTKAHCGGCSLLRLGHSTKGLATGWENGRLKWKKTSIIYSKLQNDSLDQLNKSALFWNSLIFLLCHGFWGATMLSQSPHKDAFGVLNMILEYLFGNMSSLVNFKYTVSYVYIYIYSCNSCIYIYIKHICIHMFYTSHEMSHCAQRSSVYVFCSSPPCVRTDLRGSFSARNPESLVHDSRVFAICIGPPATSHILNLAKMIMIVLPVFAKHPIW